MALVKIDWNPPEKSIREFGRNLIIFCAVLAAVSFFRGHRERAAWMLGAGFVLGAFTWAVPAGGRLVYRAWMSVAFVIGTCVSTLMLAALYYLVITPLALFFRLRGRDALALKPDDRKSYWLPLEQPTDASYWERLY